MSEPDEDEEPRRKSSQDYYAGYYWGAHPYDSYELPGRKSDSELKDSIVDRLRIKNMLDSNSITISTDNSAVVITGSVKTYAERRSIGQVVWNTSGVVEVLNNLKVTEPETAGPGKIHNQKKINSIILE
jgi:hypothetical protein